MASVKVEQTVGHTLQLGADLGTLGEGDNEVVHRVQRLQRHLSVRPVITFIPKKLKKQRSSVSNYSHQSKNAYLEGAVVLQTGLEQVEDDLKSLRSELVLDVVGQRRQDLQSTLSGV